MLQGSPADFGRLIADETEKWAKSGPGDQDKGIAALIEAAPIFPHLPLHEFALMTAVGQKADVICENASSGSVGADSYRVACLFAKMLPSRRADADYRLRPYNTIKPLVEFPYGARLSFVMSGTDC